MTLEKLTYQFIKELQKFDYELASSDRLWKILFPSQKDKEWHSLRILTYQNTFYIYHINGELGSLEVVPNENVNIEESFVFEDDELERQWLQLLQGANNWLEAVEKDWVQTYLRVQTEYPLEYRWGIVPHCLIQTTLSKGNYLVKELGQIKAKEFVKLVEDGFFSPFKREKLESMTAAQYFEYCKTAYLAIEDDIDENLTGKELYQRFADGRHEGLLDIDPNSEQEFADWIDKKHLKREGGGHPWEIVRGGSFTHIGMRVQRPSYREEGFVIELYGHSDLKLADTIKMFLAIHKAGLPIHIVEPESTRKRLLGQDKVAIVPNYETLSQAAQHFETEEDIFEVMYYENLKEQKELLTPFIKWEALPVLRLRSF